MKGIVSTPDSLTSTKTRRVYPFVFIANDEELQVKADVLFKQSLEQVNHRVLHENDLDCIMHNDFAKEEFGHWIDGIPYQMQAGVELNHDQFKDMMNSMLSDFSQGDEPDVYFYHSDLCKSREQSQAGLSYAETQQSVRSKHLGSASWITDFSGMAVQHIQYLPYGEPYINQRLSGYNERFTFTGNDPRKGWRIPLNEIKYNEQRDEETGYGYFGARYMDHELMTMWLSVDPMADKYLSISPYAYCAWTRPTGGDEHRWIKYNIVNNPIKLVDEEGKFPRSPFGIRAVFSRQVRQAVSYKMKHGGDLSVWESRGGCVFASVSTSTYTKNSVTISEKMFRPKGYTKGGQINPTTDFLVRVESWMEESSTSIVDLGLKSVANIGYSVINDPMIVFSGSSLAGTEATPNESMVAFAGTASSVLGSLLSKGMGLIKTVGESGLDKYNDFVSQMGNYQGKSKSQMGRLYQNNKNLNDAIITYKKAESGINVLSALKTED